MTTHLGITLMAPSRCKMLKKTMTSMTPVITKIMTIAPREYTTGIPGATGRKETHTSHHLGGNNTPINVNQCSSKPGV